MGSKAHLLPMKVGEQIDLSSHDPHLRRWVEWHGFTMVSGSCSTYRMQRIAPVGMRYLDRSLSVIPEPWCPINADRFIQGVRLS